MSIRGTGRKKVLEKEGQVELSLGMAKGPFRFQQFVVHQDRCAMKVSTDAVLLGAWADLRGAARILDIGTGTGLLALMAAQRNAAARIDGVEIAASAAEQAAENVEASPWKDRVRIFQTAVQDFFPAYRYDHILCNPPYFQQGLRPGDPDRSKARHGLSLPAGRLLAEALRLIEPEGKWSLIFPAEEGKRFLMLAREQGWHLDRLLEIRSRPSKAVSRYAMQLSRIPQKTLKEELVIHEGESSQYSAAYRELTGEFYL